LLFSYILQFLVVLFLYLGYVPDGGTAVPAWPGLAGVVLGAAVYGLLVRLLFARLRSQAAVQRTETRLSWLGILFLAADVYLFGLKDIIAPLPGVQSFLAFEGLIGLALFYGYLFLLWSASGRALRRLSPPSLELKRQLAGQFRSTLPLILPWLILALAIDLIGKLAPKSLQPYLASPLGEVGLVAGLIVVITLLLPPIVRYSWGCRPLPPGPVRERTVQFMRQNGVKVSEILLWPFMQGRAATAGVMGALPRLRYLLLTPALIKSLSADEIEAVLAHEAGHIKHRHLVLYLLFFLGYLVLAYVLGGLVISWLLSWPETADLLLGVLANGGAWSPALISLPILALFIVYFRFIFAYFMRHFERQADAYAARLVGPEPIIAALQKIALLSGINPRTPSWHHFSIAQRVEFIRRTAAGSVSAARHDRSLRRALIGYLAGLVLLLLVAWPAGLYTGPERINLQLALASVNQAVLAKPDQPELQLYRAALLHRLGRLTEAAEAYEKTLELDGLNPTALNDLAWLYLTGPDRLRRPEAALVIALKAAALKPEAEVLDTLAEAYFQNGQAQKAIEAAQTALAKGPKNRAYYEKQLEKFKRAERR